MEVGWRGVWLVGCLRGIGFTMSLFIAQLAFEDTTLATAKFAVLLASALAGIVGSLLGRYVLFRAPAGERGR